MKWLTMALSLVLCSVSAQAEDVWLVIGASDATPTGIAQKWKRLGERRGLIVQTRDCGESRNIFLWAAHIASSATKASESLKALRLPGGHIKQCRVQPGSLVALGETAVDPSIADVPSTAVNWEDGDRVATIHPFQGGRHIIISRYYSGSAEDALEGRRERVLLAGPRDQRHSLQDSCITPESFTATHDLLAYQCAAEQAGDQLLHKVVVFSMDGKLLKEVRNCRSPELTVNGTVACLSEAVNIDGTLHLQKIEQQL